MQGEASLETKGRFVLHDDNKAAGSADSADFSCPKCASRNSAMLETVYREGNSTSAAPPDRMEVKGWLFLALGFVLALAALQPGISVVGAGFGALGFLAATMAVRATVYNVRRLASARERWKKSAMCARCGHVFLAQP